MQLGGFLYLAQHYIGLEQTYFTALDEADNFVETVKTLKGTEPSLQTVYLLSNALIDDKLKDKLKETLPVQQLADLGAENEQMPSYVKQVIEAAAKTFSISEYMLPKFDLDLEYQVPEPGETEEKDLEELEEVTVTPKEEKVKEKEEDLDLVNNLVKPVVVGAAAAGEEAIASTELPKPQEITAEALNEGPKVDSTDSSTEKKAEAKEKETQVEEKEKVETEVVEEVVKEEKTEVKVDKEKEPKEEKSADKNIEESVEQVAKSQKEVDLAQFANLAIDPSVTKQKVITDEKDEKMKESKKELIKNKDSAGGMTKMILIGFMSFVVTIALGVGIGLAYLKFTGETSDQLEEPVAELEVTATPTPTATPEPLPEISLEDYDLLVVNATTKAGYAGETATDLEDAGFLDVAAQNAKGIYDDGNFLLVEEETPENEALLAAVEDATSLSFELLVGMEEEDSSGQYAAVVVLSE
jgi:chemotaxis protein histidine kinase CheA